MKSHLIYESIPLGPTWHCVVGRNFGSFVTHGKMQFNRRKRVFVSDIA